LWKKRKPDGIRNRINEHDPAPPGCVPGKVYGAFLNAEAMEVAPAERIHWQGASWMRGCRRVQNIVHEFHHRQKFLSEKAPGKGD
jgi:hypothetical protein